MQTSTWPQVFISVSTVYHGIDFEIELIIVNWFHQKFKSLTINLNRNTPASE